MPTSTGFVPALCEHIALMLTFRHDGRGLPDRPGGSVSALLALYTIAASCRHLTGGSDAMLLPSLVMFPLMLVAAAPAGLAVQILGAGLLGSIGVDSLAVAAALAGMSAPSDLLGWYQFAISASVVIRMILRLRFSGSPPRLPD